MFSLKARVVQPIEKSQNPSVAGPSLSLPLRERTCSRVLGETRSRVLGEPRALASLPFIGENKRGLTTLSSTLAFSLGPKNRPVPPRDPVRVLPHARFPVRHRTTIRPSGYTYCNRRCRFGKRLTSSQRTSVQTLNVSDLRSVHATRQRLGNPRHNHSETVCGHAWKASS
jgi:hypothetical protein